MKTKKETIPDSLPRAEVAKRIENFEVIRDSRFRMIFDLLPFELVVFLLADWLIGRGVFTGEALRFSATLMAILFLFATRILFSHAPQALGMIWDRDLIRNKNSNRHSLTEHFLSYLDRFEIALNNKRIWMFGLLCGIIGLTSTYPMLYFFQEGRFPPGWGLTGILSVYLWGNGSIINGLLGYLLGLLVWKIATISIFVRNISRDFEIEIQSNHPDQCGGLKPVGDISLITAILILIPAIHLSIWAFITLINPALEHYVAIRVDRYREYLVLLAVSALIVFVLPVYEIHLQMQKKAKKIRSDLDLLSQKIDEIAAELRTRAYVTTPQEGEEKLKRIEFMKKVYAEHSRVPTWPFNWKMIAQFTSVQLIPLLSLIGTSGPLIEIIKAALSAIGGNAGAK